MSSYTGYFGIAGIDPFGFAKITGNLYGHWEFKWDQPRLIGNAPNERMQQKFEISFLPKNPGCMCGCDKVSFVQTLQPLMTRNGKFDWTDSNRKTERKTPNGTFLYRGDEYTPPWYRIGNQSTGHQSTVAAAARYNAFC